MEFLSNKKSNKPINKDEKEMSFLEHLDELRMHIIRSALYILTVAIVVFIGKDFVFNNIIFGPLSKDFITFRVLCSFGDLLCFEPPDMPIITRAMGEQFLVHIQVSIWMGFIVAFPLVLREVWMFAAPGLYPKEKNVSKGFFWITSGLFGIGVLFGYFIMAPFAIKFLGEYSVGDFATTSPTLSSYVGYMVMFTIPTGIVFELPVLAFFLAKLGIIGPQMMRTYRRHAIVAIAVVAAVITPPDVITMMLIGIPIYLLYEMSIVVVQRVEKKSKKEV